MLGQTSIMLRFGQGVAVPQYLKYKKGQVQETYSTQPKSVMRAEPSLVPVHP